MPLLASVIDPGTQQPRSRMFWVIVLGVVATQLMAFWLLCSHQVRKAEARQTEVVVQQMALSDCLQYIPGSTIASCSGRARVDSQPAQAASPTLPVAQPQGNASLTGATPVSFNYR
jgi:hypothetical protein